MSSRGPAGASTNPSTSPSTEHGSAAPAPHPRVLVLGIGNLLWADEGFGVRCIEALAAGWHFDAGVTLLDGGTQGLYLLDQVRRAEVLLVFDAVDRGLAPGTLMQAEDAAVGAFLGARRLSLHQSGLQEVLAIADLFGDAPRHVLLIGVQPVTLDDYGGSLRPAVRAAIAPALAHALAYLARFGIRPVPATSAPPAPTARPHPALALATYEAGRPDATQACRHGDARVLGRARPPA